MNLEPNDSNFQLALTYGSYFYPANGRYYPESIVQCDRCLRNHLKTCIGFLNLDLCLTCAHQLESLLPDSKPYYPPSFSVNRRNRESEVPTTED